MEMDKYQIVLAITVLLICIELSGCAMPTQYIDAEKLYEIPDDYVELSEEQMNDFPHLKEAINIGDGVETPKAEFNTLFELLYAEDTKNIKYNDEYYEIGFVCADWNLIWQMSW